MKSFFPSGRWAFLILFLFLVVPTFLRAQFPDSVMRQKAAVDSILGTERLQTHGGNPMTFYSPGFTVRAKALQQLIRDCSEYAGKQWPGPDFTVRLFVLNKADWERPSFEIPYGMPFYNDVNEIMVISAEKNALARLNGQPDDPVKSDSIASGFDYVSLHELGHYFFETQHHIKKEHWVNEFLASYFFLCYIKAKGTEPDLEQHMSPRGQPPHRTLEDFEKLYGGVGPPNYDWYQRKFLQLGFALYPQLKASLVDAVLKNFAPGGKDLDLLSLLKGLAPEKVNEWLKGMQ